MAETSIESPVHNTGHPLFNSQVSKVTPNSAINIPIDKELLEEKSLQDLLFFTSFDNFSTQSKHWRLEALLNSIRSLNEINNAVEQAGEDAVAEVHLGKSTFKNPNAGIVFKKFPLNYIDNPNSLAYEERILLLLNGARDFIAITIKDEADKAARLKKLQDYEQKARKKINKKWNVGQELTTLKPGSAERKKYLDKVEEEYTYYLQKMTNKILKTIKISRQETTDELRARLYQHEIIYKSKQGRVTHINEFDAPTLDELDTTRHFSVQIPIGRYTEAQLKELGLNQADLKAASRNYTHPSNLRWQEGLANYVLHANGYVDDIGKYHVTRVSFRHASFVPVDIPDKLKRIQMTVRNIEQEIVTDAQYYFANNPQMLSDLESASTNNNVKGTKDNPLPVAINQVCLLSVLNKLIPNIAGTPKQIAEANINGYSEVLRKLMPGSLVDPQHQYEQIYLTYHAFNLFHDMPLEVPIETPEGSKIVYVKPEMSYLAMGVNSARHEFMSDPLQVEINNRTYNEFIDKVAEKFRGYVKLLSNEAFMLGEHIAITQNKLNGTTDDKTKLLLERELLVLKNKLEHFHLNAKVAELTLNAIIVKDDTVETESFKAQLMSGRAYLKEKYIELKGLLSQSKPDSKVIHQLLALIDKEREKLNKKEQQLLNLRKKIWQEKSKVLDELLNNPYIEEDLHNTALLLSQCQTLFFDKKYYEEKYNYNFQEAWLKLNDQLDLLTPNPNILCTNNGANCNDSEDRTGRFTNGNEALDIFLVQTGHVPNPDNEIDRKHYLYRLQPVTHKCSTSKDNTAENTYSPGLEIKDRDGNKHLPAAEGKKIGEHAKAPYHAPSKVKAFKKVIIGLIAGVAAFLALLNPVNAENIRNDTVNSSMPAKDANSENGSRKTDDETVDTTVTTTTTTSNKSESRDPYKSNEDSGLAVRPEEKKVKRNSSTFFKEPNNDETQSEKSDYQKISFSRLFLAENDYDPETYLSHQSSRRDYARRNSI